MNYIKRMKLPPYEVYPKICGNRVSLRQIRKEDIINIIEISFYNSVQATTLEEAIQMQSKIEQNYHDGNSIHWGIADNTTDKIIGTCGYYRGLDKGEGELGCVLLNEYRGKGFMTEAMNLAIDFGLKNIHLHRIWAITSKQNEKAIQLLQRLNFKLIAELENDDIEFEYIK